VKEDFSQIAFLAGASTGSNLFTNYSSQHGFHVGRGEPSLALKPWRVVLENTNHNIPELHISRMVLQADVAFRQARGVRGNHIVSYKLTVQRCATTLSECSGLDFSYDGAQPLPSASLLHCPLEIQTFKDRWGYC